MFAVWPVYVIALVLLISILRNQTQGQLQAIALALAGHFIYIGWMFGHIAFLANAKDAYGYLFYLIFAVELNDVAAYTFGKTFGRHPLQRNISPKKTSGNLGSAPWRFSIAAAVAPCGFRFPDFTSARFDFLTGLIVGIAGQLGDLSMSVIKRDLGIKDMGSLIGGHGGILDRIDSLIYVVPLVLPHGAVFPRFLLMQRQGNLWHYDTFGVDLDRSMIPAAAAIFPASLIFWSIRREPRSRLFCSAPG